MAGGPILIAGAGMAGLATAVALARQGRDVHIVERAAKEEKMGAGVQLGPNAQRALVKLGLWNEVKTCANGPFALHIRNAVTGAILQQVKFDADFEVRFGMPYLVAHRAELHAVLLELARTTPRIKFTMNQEVKYFAIKDDAVSVSTESGNKITGDILLAADGINSKIRSQIFPRSEARALPYTIYRVLLDMPKTAQDVDLTCVNLWLGPTGHAVMYPVSSRLEKLNLVYTANGFSSAPDPQFQDLCKPLTTILNSAPAWSTWPAQHVRKLPTWHHDRVCLLGDAAHGTVPFLAQGAAMAFEDANEIVGCLKDFDDPTKAFSAFESARQERTAQLDAQSRRVIEIYHYDGLRAFIRNWVLRVSPTATLNGLNWLYSY